MRPRRGREAPGGTKRTKRGRSDDWRSGRTTRTAREAIRIIGPLANDEDDDEKTTAEQGTASAVVFSSSSSAAMTSVVPEGTYCRCSLDADRKVSFELVIDTEGKSKHVYLDSGY